MSVANETYISPEQYLAGETDADVKNEYHRGVVAALPGASPEHTEITANVAGELRLQFKGRPYRVFANHLRIKVGATSFYTYPDVVVICDQPIIALEGERPNTVLNPILIVEVMSEATTAADQGKKFDNYRHIPTLREYILVSELESKIVSFLRPEAGDDWERTEVSAPNDLLYLTSVDCTLAIADIYPPRDA
jgi:Uma2 family endonuclease